MNILLVLRCFLAVSPRWMPRLGFALWNSPLIFSLLMVFFHSICLCMYIMLVLSCSLEVSSRWMPCHSSGTLCRHEFTWFCYTEHATQIPLINSLLPLFLSICVYSVCSESSSLVRLRYMFCHSSVTLCRHDSTWVCCTVHASHCLCTAGLFPHYRSMYVYPVSSASFPSGQFEVYIFCLSFIFAFSPGYLLAFPELLSMN